MQIYANSINVILSTIEKLPHIHRYTIRRFSLQFICIAVTAAAAAPATQFTTLIFLQKSLTDYTALL